MLYGVKGIDLLSQKFYTHYCKTMPYVTRRSEADRSCDDLV